MNKYWVRLERNQVLDTVVEAENEQEAKTKASHYFIDHDQYCNNYWQESRGKDGYSVTSNIEFQLIKPVHICLTEKIKSGDQVIQIDLWTIDLSDYLPELFDRLIGTIEEKDLHKKLENINKELLSNHYFLNKNPNVTHLVSTIKTLDNHSNLLRQPQFKFCKYEDYVNLVDNLRTFNSEVNK